MRSSSGTITVRRAAGWARRPRHHRHRGRVDAHVSLPSTKVAAVAGGDDRRQDEPIGQSGEAFDRRGVRGRFPCGGDLVGFGRGQSAASVAAGRVQGGGDPVERPVDASARGHARVVVRRGVFGNAQPGTGFGSQAVEQDPPRVRERCASQIMGREHQTGQDGAMRQTGRARASGEHVVRCAGNPGAFQQREEPADFGVLDQPRTVRAGPGAKPPCGAVVATAARHRRVPRSSARAWPWPSSGTNRW